MYKPPTVDAGCLTDHNQSLEEAMRMMLKHDPSGASIYRVVGSSPSYPASAHPKSNALSRFLQKRSRPVRSSLAGTNPPIQDSR
jgi:hypothetical protein